MSNEPITWKEMEAFANQLTSKINGNAPIAWYNADDSSLSFKNHGGGWQPLYTHPAKTLTDRIAELEKELKRTKFAWNLAENELEALKYEKSSGVYDLAKTLTELSGVEIIGMSGKYDFNYEVDIIDFARAILRKAQEK